MSKYKNIIYFASLLFATFIIISIFHIYNAINLSTTYCTGTGTGLNTVLLVCNEEYWFPISLIAQIIVSFATFITLHLIIKDFKNKIILGIGYLTFLIIFNLIFYQPEIFSFWLINITGQKAIA